MLCWEKACHSVLLKQKKIFSGLIKLMCQRHISILKYFNAYDTGNYFSHISELDFFDTFMNIIQLRES